MQKQPSKHPIIPPNNSHLLLATPNQPSIKPNFPILWYTAVINAQFRSRIKLTKFQRTLSKNAKPGIYTPIPDDAWDKKQKKNTLRKTHVNPVWTPLPSQSSSTSITSTARLPCLDGTTGEL